MAVNLSPYGGVGAQFLDNAGNVLTGGKIFTYAAGTTTPQATYTTSAGNIPHPNPIILDAAGRVPGGEIWLTDGLVYKFILRDANDVLIATYDGITGINSNFVAFTNQQEIQTATAGQTVFNLATLTYQPGTNSLSVFVDGVNQYGPGAQYAYLETDSDTVTFVNGLHVGAEVKFTTSQLNTSGSTNTAGQISFTGFKGQAGTVQNLADDDGSDWIGFEQAGTSAVARSAQDKMQDVVSVKDFGAVGDGVANDTAAIQAAINYATSNNLGIYLPSGTYLVNGGLTENTNAGALTIFGAGQRKSTIQLAPGITNTSVFNVGTTSGHGAYRLNFHDFSIQGNSSSWQTDNNIAIECPEGGISHVYNMFIRFFEYGVYGEAWTGALIDGKCEINSCTYGVYLPRGGGNNSPSNIMAVRNVWFSACDQAVFIEGGLPEVSGCTLQSCGLSGNKYLIHCYDDNSGGSSAKFAGARVFNNWAEGGTYKYAIFVENLRNSIVYDNHIIGSSNAGTATKEGAILLSAISSKAYGNDIYQFFTKTPTDGRLANAGVYVTNACQETYNIMNNMLTRTQTGNQYYFEGGGSTPYNNPTANRDISRSAFGFFSVSAGVATLQYGKGIRSATQVSTGLYTITLEYNRDLASTPVFVQTSSTSEAAIFASVDATQSAQTVRVHFYDSAGADVEPDGFSVFVMGSINTI